MQPKQLQEIIQTQQQFIQELEERIRFLQDCLVDSRNDNKHKETLIEGLTNSCQSLKEEIGSLSDELATAKTKQIDLSSKNETTRLRLSRQLEKLKLAFSAHQENAELKFKTQQAKAQKELKQLAQQAADKEASLKFQIEETKRMLTHRSQRSEEELLSKKELEITVFIKQNLALLEQIEALKTRLAEEEMRRIDLEGVIDERSDTLAHKKTEERTNSILEQMQSHKNSMEALHKDWFADCVYTHQLNTPEKRLAWWNQLSLNWKRVLLNSIDHEDTNSIPLDESLVTLLSLTTLESDGQQFLEYDRLSDLDGLRFLQNLDTLNLAGHSIENIEGLRHLQNLKQLDLSSNHISSIAVCKYLSALENLNLAHNRIRDLDGIQYLVNLKKLIAHHNPIKQTNLLASLVNLQVLDMQHCQLQDMEGLSHLSQLNTVNLQNNEIQKIEDLPRSVRLNSLSLRQNSLTPKQLMEVMSLIPIKTELYFESNHLSKDDLLRLEQHLLQIKGKPIPVE